MKWSCDTPCDTVKIVGLQKPRNICDMTCDMACPDDPNSGRLIGDIGL